MHSSTVTVCVCLDTTFMRLSHAVRPIISLTFSCVCNATPAVFMEMKMLLPLLLLLKISGVLIDKHWFKPSIFRAIVKMICRQK